jgi:hypothetical protein
MFVERKHAAMEHDYAMFSEEGNQEVAGMVREVKVLSLKDGEMIKHELETRMVKIAGDHREVWDTTVKEKIATEFEEFIPNGEYYALWLSYRR